MIESPILQELKAEWRRETRCRSIAHVLAARFGVDAKGWEAELNSVDDGRLDRLIELSATCPDLESFRKHLSR